MAVFYVVIFDNLMIIINGTDEWRGSDNIMR